MSFFDDKEEVLEFVMTKHGERKFSMGEFDPVYYSFGDSDILYNSDFGGFSEDQTDIKDRIFSTVRLKPQNNFGGIESEFEKNKNNRVSETDNFYSFEQSEADRTHATVKSLGTSRAGSDIYPSWTVRCYNTGIETVRQFVTGTANVKIPQINLTLNKAYINKILGVPSNLTNALLGAGIPSLDLGDRFNSFPDGSVLEVPDQDILIEIEEFETDDEFDNFEVEFFFVEVQKTAQTPIKVLTPLKFLRSEDENTSLDPDIWQPAPLPNIEAEPNPNFVEYFLEVNFDRDIDPNLLCRFVEQDKAKGVYGSRIVEQCKDNKIQLRDIYETGITEEEC